jgi:aminomethyltransferase
MLKRTPLYAAHTRLGARLVEFGGWEMPVQYTSIIDEHQAVRERAGLFDISHMGEVTVGGPAALEFLNGILTNDLRKLSPGQGQYTLMPNERGGVVDDLYAYRLAPEEYLLIINASRIEPDVAWLEKQLATFPKRSEIALKNISSDFGAVALQGPAAVRFIDRIPEPGSARPPSALQKNELGSYMFNGTPIWISRTGYTGEDGFELVGPNAVMEPLWDKLLKEGQAYGLKPAGLGARDTLRTEMCYPLYGHELDENTTPIEAGVGFFVSLDKGPFVGREIMAAQKATGPSRKCVAFKMAEKSAPPRPGYPILSGTEKVGQVVSGTQSPSLGVGIGLGYVPATLAKPGTALNIEIRGRTFPATIVPKPIYRKAG